MGQPVGARQFPGAHRVALFVDYVPHLRDGSSAVTWASSGEIPQQTTPACATFNLKAFRCAIVVYCTSFASWALLLFRPLTRKRNGRFGKAFATKPQANGSKRKKLTQKRFNPIPPMGPPTSIPPRSAWLWTIT